MLVLSRRAGESIRIGDDIELIVAQVQGGGVKLGIRAPEHVTIMRSELADRETTRLSPAMSEPPGSSNEKAPSCQPCSTHGPALMLA